MDDMHCQLVQAPPCSQSSSSSSLLPPPGQGVGDPCSFLAACLLFLAAICCIIVVVNSRNGSKLRRRRRRPRTEHDHHHQEEEAESSNENEDAVAAAPPPPPGRGRWWWTVAETLSFVAANSSGRGFYHFVQARHRRYGAPCFRTALFGHTHVFVSSPDAARPLLAADADHAAGFSKRYVRTVADLLGEHSLLCASHAAHRALRRAVAPLFNARATASLAAAFDARTRSLVARDWAAAPAATCGRRRVVVLDAALGITFEAICDMLMATLRPDTKRQLQSDVLAVTRAMLAFPLRLPGTRFYAGLKARTRIMEVLRQEIASRKRHLLSSMEDDEQDQQQQQLDDDDFLQSLLLRQQQSPSSGLTDDQILDNILTLIIAGQVTTATAITWMVKYLADNRDLQETLRSVQMELALKHPDGPLTLQHLNSMELAYMTVKESLRMASIVSWFPRVALEDCQVAGFRINKGWIVNIDARALHYDPTVYDNPTMFDPSRFKQQGEGEDDSKQQAYRLLVFGAGGRTCLGMNLAKIMMLIFLHRLVTTWRWEMADDDPSLEKWAMFPRLKNGCPIHLTPI